MYQQLTDRVGVLTGGVNIGVISTESGSVVMVDSGANAGNARKTLRFIRDELNADVDGILCTHGHADHFGGNAFIVKRTDAAVYAPRGVDASMIEHPELQPVLLYGGAAPPEALRARFVWAEASPVDALVDPGLLEIADISIDVIPLFGHSPNQVGYLVDGVFFCADVVFPQDAIDKYRIPYLFDLGTHLQSMAHALTIGATSVVPGHGPTLERIDSSVDLNRAIVEETIGEVLAALDTPRTLEQICALVFDKMQVPMPGHVSYYLLRPTIGAYLTHLEAQGQIEHVMQGASAMWRRV